MNYRAEIDGLRAIAVIPVILYHAGFSLFQGGFIGVDVFFVISGFLITSIIIKAVDEGRFSLIEFYERRAKRLLPAFVVMLVVCVPLAWAFLLPNQMKLFAFNLFSAVFFAANISYSVKGDYFSINAHDDPLAHTWSLSVEEQFYLIFPLFLIVCLRWFKTNILLLVSLLMLASLMTSIWLAQEDWNRGFYLAHARAWEMLAGCTLAIGMAKKALPANQWAAMMGLCAIVGSYVLFDPRMYQLPGLLTVVPVLGTLLVIGFGHRGTITHAMLSQKSLVYIGLVSYSAYLWHQPVLAFGRLAAHRFTNIDPGSAVLMSVLCVISMAIAWMSWRWVEVPCRKGTLLSKNRLILPYSMGGVAVCTFAFALLVLNTNGVENRFSAPESVVESIDFEYRRDECFDLDNTHTREDWTCTLGIEEIEPTVFVMGDSHSYAMLAGLDMAFQRMGISAEYAGLPGCVPLLGVHLIERYDPLKDCYALKERFFEHVKASGGKHVILAGAWSYYSGGGVGRGNIFNIGTNPNDRPSANKSKETFPIGVETTIEHYSQIGVVPIFIGQVPDQKLHPLQHYQPLSKGKGAGYLDSAISKREHVEIQSIAADAFILSGADLIDPTPMMCNDSICPFGNEHYSYYFDEDHLSVMGSKRMAPFLHKELSKRVKTDQMVKL